MPILFRMKRDLAKAEGNEGVLRAGENDWLRDGFGREARFRSFVAEQDAAIVGMIIYGEVYMTALGGPIFSIQDLYVEPAFRKHGGGAALVAKVPAAAVEGAYRSSSSTCCRTARRENYTTASASAIFASA